jgi:16S rRNA (cytidine1402-2'-O)-methyltransferase
MRALRVLSQVSLILAEDTRHTHKLLAHYGITTRLMSYHQHNKRTRLDAALHALQQGDVALVSNAGLPAVSDPGFELIRAAVDAGVEVDVLPGPSAVTTAVVAAAFPAAGFLFMGFLPRSAADRRRRLADVASLPYSLVIFEAPHRLVATLESLLEVIGDREIVAARELTKLHQEVVRSTLAGLVDRYCGEEARGEFTLVVAGGSPQLVDHTAEARAELLQRRLHGQTARSAIAEVAAKYDLSRNAAYQLWVEVDKTGDQELASGAS